MCKVFKVSRSGFYEWLNRKPSRRAMENRKITDQLKLLYEQSKGRYGSPKLCVELRDRGFKVSRPRVARLMRSEGIRSIIRPDYRVCTTDSEHGYPVAPNILNREFKADSPARVWVSDITYIKTAMGWLYLTIIMDLFDRKIVGWSMATGMTAGETIVPAWKMAVKNRSFFFQLLFHSDRGVQYACNEFKDLLKDSPVTQSMSRKGNCWDNAVAENFFKIIKSEMIWHDRYRTTIEAKTKIFEFIEIWYNKKRKHSYLNYMTPEQFGELNKSKAA